MNRLSTFVLAAFLAAAIVSPLPADAAKKDKKDKVVKVGDRYRGTITFTSKPRMALVPDTRVYYMRDAADYDLYQTGNFWYLVDHGKWYRARSWEGPFTYVRTNSVPRDVRTIPTGYRRSWTTASTSSGAGSRVRATRVGSRYEGSNLRFTSAPSMAVIPDSRVYYLRDESDLDLYRYGNDWYYVDDGTWYRASSWRGPFLAMRSSNVPAEILNVPAGYRRSWTYPSSVSAGASRVRATSVGHRYRGTSMNFTTRPNMAIIPDTRVYYLRDESDLDLYQYGNRWYYVEDGTWYRANSWQGPYVSIRSSAVPREILTVPSGYRRSWVPTSSSIY